MRKLLWGSVIPQFPTCKMKAIMLLPPCWLLRDARYRVGGASEDRLPFAMKAELLDLCSCMVGPCQPWKASNRGCLGKDQSGGTGPLPGTGLRWGWGLLCGWWASQPGEEANARASSSVSGAGVMPHTVRAPHVLMQGKEQLKRFEMCLCVYFFDDAIWAGINWQCSLMGGMQQVRPCEKALLKYFRWLILAYQCSEMFGIDSVAILPRDFSNLIGFFFLKHCML